MNVRTTAANEAEQALARQFAEFEPRLPGGPAWARRRGEAFRQFADRGLPGRRVEAWHYTDLRNFMRRAHAPGDHPARPAQVAAADLMPLRREATPIVLVDGVFRPDLSGAEDGLTTLSLEDALRAGEARWAQALAPSAMAGDSVVALNSAFMDRGVVIDVAPGVRLVKPVEIIHIATDSGPRATYVRSLARIGASGSASVIERGTGDKGERQINAALIVDLEEGAELHLARVADAASDALRVESVLARLAEKARLTSFILAARAVFLRRQMWVRFIGEDASAVLSGASLARAAEHIDNTLVVEHAAARCRSRENFRHVVDGQATCVFQGKIIVAPHAQKTDGVMSSRCLLLSDDAAMYNKPELEIFADDVICGHGATCGALDKDQLFYVMARGLSRPQAETLLLEAFAADSIAAIADESLREVLEERVRDWLAERGA